MGSKFCHNNMSTTSRNKIDVHRAMIDIETLDIRTTAIVMAIAAVVFRGATSVNTFKVHVDVEGQEKLGLTRGEGTVEFWNKPENKEAFDDLAKNTVPLADALKNLSAFLRKYNIDQYWAKGPDFDFKILENAYRACEIGKEIPWKHWEMRDVRTVEKYLNEKKLKHEVEQQGIAWRERIARDYKQTICKHNPLYDCYVQILTVLAFEDMLVQRASSEGNIAVRGVRKLKLEFDEGNVVVKIDQ